ncbi:MAG TPA: hypothetical protein PLG81_00870 [bacterium]|jgi:hypothetical protein|nr:MAG: hypothetical protein BWX53_00506 [Parcubacteria group bacterium ADurb.Bin016]HOE81333.1 hypothetical protein [bacterium]HRS73287.1 hypothetical protein [Patescibacteria group bacterium]HOR69092.1 hypothetical protein [bacterium]HOS88689.1 hypothetical protein [bacterium]
MLEDQYPRAPYILQSGKYRGKSLEYVLLHDVSSFLAMKHRLEDVAQGHQPNAYHRHLVWLVTGINILAGNVTCRECGKYAEYLPARGNYREGLYFLSVPLCRQCANQGEWERTLKFNILPWHICSLPLSKADRNKLWKAEKNILKINNMSGQQLFELLVDIN